MRKVSIDSEDDEIFPDESGKMSSIEAANVPKKMRYLKKIYSSLAFIFVIFAGASMTLFITPGVREFVQQYQVVVYLCTPLPLVSKLIFSAVERLRSTRNVVYLLFVALAVHLLSIFLSLTSLSLFFNTEFLYFSCLTVFLNLLILTMYTFQNYKLLSLPVEMTIFLLTASIGNVIFVEIILSIFDFPYMEIAVLSLIVSMYLEYNIRFFMKTFNSREWPMAVCHVFVHAPV